MGTMALRAIVPGTVPVVGLVSGRTLWMAEAETGHGFVERKLHGEADCFPRLGKFACGRQDALLFGARYEWTTHPVLDPNRDRCYFWRSGFSNLLDRLGAPGVLGRPCQVIC